MNVYIGEGLAVFLFILLDVVSGVVKSAMLGILSSSKMREGLMHKFSYIVVLVLSYMIELGQSYTGIRIDFPLITSVVAFIIISEVMSIFENCCEMNPELKGSRVAKFFDLTSKESDDNVSHVA